MIYAVHTTHDGAVEYFTDYRSAFRWFRSAVKNRHSDTALWHGTRTATVWTRLHASENYPEKLSRPPR